MKRVFALILLAVLLSGCTADTADPEPYTVELDDWGKTVTLTVDPDKQTISDGTYLYTYRIRNVNENRYIVIEYPNGATYDWSGTTGVSTGVSAGYDPDTYISGAILVSAITDHGPEKTNAFKEQVRKATILGPILIICGLLTLAFPRLAWWDSWKFVPYEWRAPYTEQMERNLKILGIVMAVLGVVFLLVIYFYAYL